MLRGDGSRGSGNEDEGAGPRELLLVGLGEAMLPLLNGQVFSPSVLRSRRIELATHAAPRNPRWTSSSRIRRPTRSRAASAPHRVARAAGGEPKGRNARAGARDSV